MFDNILDIRSLLSDTKRCARCHDRDGSEIDLEATRVYDPSQCLYVSAWECPECGHTVYRDTGDGVTMIEPPQ